MKNLVIPRNDDRCALCRIAKANETGSHMVPNLLTAVAFSFDGKYKRDREIVEKYHKNAPDSNSVHYGRNVAADKVTADLGHEMTDEELDNNINTLCYDYIFCKDCEKRFGVLETAFGDYYKTGKSLHPRLAYLFWLSVFWRMSIGYMGLFMDARDELDIRGILDKNLKIREEITGSTEKMGDYGYAVFRLDEPLSKGDSGVFGTNRPRSPYVILVADQVVVLFTNYSKLHKKTIVFGYEIDKDNINTYRKDDYIELEMSIEELYDFKKQIVESTYDVFGREQEEMARRIREMERTSGKACSKKDFYAIMQLLKPREKKMRVRQAYRFRAAYVKMLEARARGEEYDFLKDRELMLTQDDVNNYIEDLNNFKARGISLVPFAFAREFLHDDSIPPFEDTLAAAKKHFESEHENAMNLEEIWSDD